MIISISGMPGSGKTSVAKILAQELNVPFYSVGGLRGKMALERGITLDELNALGEEDDSTDKMVDDYQKELGAKGGDFVIEGRLSWYFIPHSFKIFLDCSLDEAAKRITKSKSDRPDEEIPDNSAEMRELIQARVASDIKRYDKYYGVDYRDPGHYDLVLDTTGLKSPEETADLIKASLSQRLDSKQVSG